MGIYDRDYYRRPTGGFTGFGGLQAWNVNAWLIAVNVAVYVLDRMLNRLLTAWGAFSMSTALWHLQLWRFITFQFLHASVEHILFNMIGLYFFGPIVESQLGGRKYLAFYLSCGVAGALSYVGLSLAQVLGNWQYSYMVGASAGIFGVLLACARLAPNLRVMLLFPPIPLRLVVLVWGYIAFALYTVVVHGPNAGGQAAHLGGALWGFILIRNPHWLNWLAPRWRRRFRDWRR